jgi:DegV family protein with EDD domain
VRFSACLERGNEVIGIFISSELSGTLQSAIIAKNQLKSDDIYLIDSRTATVALGLLVRTAARLRDEGHTAKEICAQIEEIKPSLCFFAFVESLKYLKKGGRLSAGAALAGTLLGIKPVLQLAEGRLEAVAKTRGSAAACEKIAELIRASRYSQRHRAW